MKFIIVGDSGVGKSCLLLRFVQDFYRSTHELTIGVEFGVRTIKIGDLRVKLQIWDTAGQEAFRSITRSFYRAATGALLVFDVTRRSSFAHLEEWKREVQLHAASGPALTVVANKCDLQEQREVSSEEALQFAADCGGNYVETSALSGEAVHVAFATTAEAALAAEGCEGRTGVLVTPPPPQRGSCC